MESIELKNTGEFQLVEAITVPATEDTHSLQAIYQIDQLTICRWVSKDKKIPFYTAETSDEDKEWAIKDVPHMRGVDITRESAESLRQQDEFSKLPPEIQDQYHRAAGKLDFPAVLLVMPSRFLTFLRQEQLANEFVEQIQKGTPTTKY